MNKRALVAYASKYGATAEIAIRIGQVLAAAGWQVDVLPVKRVKNLYPYQAVVMGSAAYMFRWRPEVVSFIKDNMALLATVPTWFFYSGPLGRGDALTLARGERYPRKLQPLMDIIRPRDVAVFHGFLNMDRLNPFERFVFKRTADMQGDFRDWQAITAWAEGIAAWLQNSTTTYH